MSYNQHSTKSGRKFCLVIGHIQNASTLKLFYKITFRLSVQDNVGNINEILWSHSLYIRKYSACVKYKNKALEALWSQKEKKIGSLVFASVAPSKWS